MKLTIDPEFKALLPPLSSEEIAQLEVNLTKYGCRDALVTWNGTIVDGHNRYEICTRKKIPFKTVAIKFADRDAAMDWMDANAIGKRNLTPANITSLLGRRYNRTKHSKAEAGSIGGSSKAQNGTCLTNTAATIAKQHGVSKNTVKRAGEFVEAADKLGLGDDVKSGKIKRASGKIVETAKRGIPELLEMLNTGEIDFKTASAVAALPEDTQKEAVAAGVFGINRAAKGKSISGDEEPPSRVKRDTYKPEEGKNLTVEAKIKLDRILDRDLHFEWAMKHIIAYCEKRLKNKK